MKAKKMSQRGAARYFNVPKSVISSRICGKYSVNQLGTGRAPIFSKEMEEEIYQYIRKELASGQKHSKDDMLRLIGKFINDRNWKAPFKHGIPGKRWYSLFLARHTELNTRKKNK